MKAMQVEDFGKLILAENVPTPVPGYEEALIKVSSSGVCHSDVHIANGDWIKFKPPGLGHEGIGIVEELGQNAEKFVKKGDRVIFGLGGTAGADWCGSCEFCLSGRPMLCLKKQNIMGSFAEYISIKAKALVQIPDELGDNEVPLACAGLTAYSAIKKLANHGVAPGATIAIVGAAGGLGHYAIQIAKVFGYEVVGIDVGADKIEFAKTMGADYAVEVSESADFIKKKFHGVHASLVLAPKIAAFELGLDILRTGGVLVASGMPALSEGAFSVTPFFLILKGITIITSLVGTVQEMRELVGIAASGKVKTHVGRTLKLSETGDVIKELEKGLFFGRAVINKMDE